MYSSLGFLAADYKVGEDVNNVYTRHQYLAMRSYKGIFVPTPRFDR